MKTTHEIIANNVKKIIDYRQINQAELASKTGLSQKTISNILNPGSVGSITTASIERVASYLKIPPYQLMIPDLPIEVLLSKEIAKVISFYVESSEIGRNNINQVAEMAAHYTPKETQKNITYSFDTSAGTFFIVKKPNQRWYIIYKNENLGSYSTPQRAADDLSGGHTFSLSGGIDTSTLGISHDISDWNIAK